MGDFHINASSKKHTIFCLVARILYILAMFLNFYYTKKNPKMMNAKILNVFRHTQNRQIIVQGHWDICSFSVKCVNICAKCSNCVGLKSLF